MSTSGEADLRGCTLTIQGPAFEASGVAEVRFHVDLLRIGQPRRSGSSYRYVHCARSNFQAVVNGVGSSID